MTGDGLTAADFDIRNMVCPKCGMPAKVYTLRATGDNFLVCRWGDCEVGTMEGIYNCIWKSLTDGEKEKVRELRNETAAND